MTSKDYKQSWELAERSLEIIRSIRPQYNEMIKEAPWLIGADTVLGMIDDALAYTGKHDEE